MTKDEALRRLEQLAKTRSKIRTNDWTWDYPGDWQKREELEQHERMYRRIQELEDQCARLVHEQLELHDAIRWIEQHPGNSYQDYLKFKSVTEEIAKANEGRPDATVSGQ